jgi:prepilin-type N-terminal cleavage/methylation domain-containing protein
MTAGFEQATKRKANAGFTLVEVVMSIAILALAMAGMIYGYVQTNYRAKWSSMSLAAQSLASQAVEEALAAKWDIHSGTSGTGPGTSDELPATSYTPSYTQTNTMLVPGSGQSIVVTNYVSITQLYNNPPVRQIRADCVWPFQSTGQWFTNTVVTWRGAY